MWKLWFLRPIFLFFFFSIVRSLAVNFSFGRCVFFPLMLHLSLHVMSCAMSISETALTSFECTYELNFCFQNVNKLFNWFVCWCCWNDDYVVSVFRRDSFSVPFLLSGRFISWFSLRAPPSPTVCANMRSPISADIDMPFNSKKQFISLMINYERCVY